VRRVVADTNVLVSSIQFGGKPKQLIDLAADGHIDLAISEAILEETLRVLRDKFHHTPDELRETDKQLRVIARTVAPAESIRAVDADPSDNHILECAVAADAEVILSGDKHLLALGSFREIPIQRVGEFLAVFQERRRVGP
jgi:putative PIN family toxin of toxin-antitoxin system